MANENIRRVYEIDVKLAGDAVAALRAMQQSLKATEDQSRRTQEATKGAFAVLGKGGGLGGAVLALGGVIGALKQIGQVLVAPVQGFQQLTISVLEVQANLERLRLGFASISGTTGENALRQAGRDIEFVRKVTQGLGTDFQSGAQSFLKLSASARGTALEGEKAKETFEAISLASRNLGLSIPQTENAFRALEQIISKGVVQQEELRGQLSEALPGAVQIAARALGLTTAELNDFIATGQLTADVFIPAFSRQLKKEFGAEIPGSVNEATKALNTFKSETEQLKQAITDSGIGSFFAGQLNILSNAFADVTRSVRAAKEEGGGFFAQLLAATGASARFANPFNAFSYVEQIDTTSLEAVQKTLSKIGKELEEGEKKGRKNIDLIYEEIRLRGIERSLLKNREDTTPGVAETRQIENARLARVENNRLIGVLGDLQQKYKNNNEIQRRELAELDKIRDTVGLTAEEYKRLRDAIIAKTSVQSAGQRAAEKELESAQNLSESLREQIKVQQQLGTNEEEIVKVLRQRAQIEEELKKVKTAAARDELQRALVLTQQLELETRSAKAREETLKVSEEVRRASSERVRSLTEEAKADETAALVLGDRQEQLRAVKIAELEAAEASATRDLLVQIERQGDEKTIKTLDDLVKALRRAREAKVALGAAETEKEFQDIIKKDEERQKKRLEEQEDDVKGFLTRAIRNSGGDAGKALLDSIRSSIEDRVFRILVEPQLDILAKQLNAALEIFAQYLSNLISNSLGSLGGAGGGGNGILGSLGSLISGFIAPGSGGFGTGAGFGSMDYGQFFAEGGYLPAGQIGVVGDGGVPELIKGGPAGTTIMPFDKLGGKVTVNVYEAPPGTRVSERDGPDGKIIDIFIRQAKKAVAADFRSGGEVSMAAQQALGARRNTPRTGF